MPDPNDPRTPLWNIAEVERDTGLHKDTLRVWERRYGFPTPTRDANGERLYDEAQLARLLQIKRLLNAGHRPGRIVALPPQEIAALLQRQQAPECEPVAGRQDWLALLEQAPQGLRAALRQQLQQLGLAAGVEQLVAPLSRQVGEAWLAGRLAIHQEHLFSEVVQSLLREAIAVLDAEREPQPPRVLLTTLPQEQHQLGLLMAECYFALERCERIALGPNTPLPEIVASVQRFDIEIVALSVSVHAPPRDVTEQLQRLRQQLPAAVELWVGGGGVASSRRKLPDGVQRMQSAQQVGAGVARWRTAKGWSSGGAVGS